VYLKVSAVPSLPMTSETCTSGLVLSDQTAVSLTLTLVQVELKLEVLLEVKKKPEEEENPDPIHGSST